jgi:hypothetical protein
MTRTGWIVMMAGLALAGCAGTETGNPPFAPSVGAQSGVPMGILPRLSIERAWIAVERVALEPGADCTTPIEGTTVRAAPAALSLTEAQVLETDAVLEVGDYCAFRFERAPWTGREPSTLSGYTLAIDGALPDGLPVVIRSRREGALRFVGATPFEMSPEAGGLLVFVDESLLFDGVPFDTAEVDPEGVLVIDEVSNTALLDRIESQLPGALTLHRDADGDGMFSPDERRVGPLATVVP